LDISGAMKRLFVRLQRHEPYPNLFVSLNTHGGILWDFEYDDEGGTVLDIVYGPDPDGFDDPEDDEDDVEAPL
jgi:hypothetical protein